MNDIFTFETMKMVLPRTKFQFDFYAVELQHGSSGGTYFTDRLSHNHLPKPHPCSKLSPRHYLSPSFPPSFSLSLSFKHLVLCNFKCYIMSGFKICFLSTPLDYSLWMELLLYNFRYSDFGPVFSKDF